MPSLRQVIRSNLSKRGFRVPAAFLNKDQRFFRNTAQSLSRSDVVIDLGAHIGLASVEFSHTAGHVYAFEPISEIFTQLKRNVAPYQRITPIHKAASDKTGSATIFFDPAVKPGRHKQGATLAEGKSNVSYETSQQVDTVNIADFIRELDTDIKMIKMDIEGFEYRVINALLDGDVMDRIGIVNVEDHCDRIEGLAAERDATLKKIEAAGYNKKFDFTWP